MGRKPKRGPGPEVIAGDVVRQLVERNEAQIADLRRQLATALREAEEAERRFGRRTGRGSPSSPGVNGASAPDQATSDAGGGPTKPRTTVVSRPRSAAPAQPKRR